jgi:threonine dehydrogenase-like Zn-dependent dehydrogenase
VSTHGRAAVYVGSGQPFEIREYPVPEPEPGAAGVRITLANVCGSDLHLWRGELDPAKRGRALPIHQGHEGTGRIAALGAGVTVDSNGQPLAVGDRVVFAYFFPCGRCRQCLGGREFACPMRMQYRATSCEVWPNFKGTFGDYFYLHPNHAVFRVPDDLSDELVVGVNCAMAQVTCGTWPLGVGETVVIRGGRPRPVRDCRGARCGAGRIVVVDGVAERWKSRRCSAPTSLSTCAISRRQGRAQARARADRATRTWSWKWPLPAITEEGVQMSAGGATSRSATFRPADLCGPTHRTG